MEVFEAVRTVGFLGLGEVKGLLGIPDSLDVLAIVPFGYPAQPRAKGKKAAEAALRGGPP